ncbi:MAG: cell division protein ZapA [Lachnospiraceae bacterium]|nr:cell division protein ZapA [Lachnospiraceae bacterium]
MSKAIDVEVLIGDRQYTISGVEGSEYIQKIATHINGKLAEFRKQEGYATLDVDMKNILLAINLSDDYYKAMEELQEVRAEYQDKEREIFDMKHELVSMQSKMDKLVEESNQIKVQQNEDEHSVIRMEAKYEQASQNEEKSRLELTRLEKRLKMVQEAEQRAQTKKKELEKELEEQKKLLQKLSSYAEEGDLEAIQTELAHVEPEQETAEQTKTDNGIIETADSENTIIGTAVEETNQKENADSSVDGNTNNAGTRKTKSKKSSRKSRRR